MNTAIQAPPLPQPRRIPTRIQSAMARIAVSLEANTFADAVNYCIYLAPWPSWGVSPHIGQREIPKLNVTHVRSANNLLEEAPRIAVIGAQSSKYQNPHMLSIYAESKLSREELTCGGYDRGEPRELIRFLGIYNAFQINVPRDSGTCTRLMHSPAQLVGYTLITYRSGAQWSAPSGRRSPPGPAQFRCTSSASRMIASTECPSAHHLLPQQK